MGCGQSKEEIETGHIHIKTKRKSKKSKDLKSESTQLIQPKEEESKNEDTHLEKHVENLDNEASIEGLICDGISGKTEYFSPKKSNTSNENGNGDEDFNEDKEKVFLNGENDHDLSIEEVICDGVSGKTEYYSPKRANEGDKKEDIDDDGNGNGNSSVEGVICDGCSGKTEYYSPKKSIDDVVVEDKEVLVEEKTGEAKKTGETEEKIGNDNLDKTEFSSLEKTNNDVEENDFPSKEKKESETETTVHVSGFAFDSLLSWWKTREV